MFRQFYRFTRFVPKTNTVPGIGFRSLTFSAIPIVAACTTKDQLIPKDSFKASYEKKYTKKEIEEICNLLENDKISLNIIPSDKITKEIALASIKYKRIM